MLTLQPQKLFAFSLVALLALSVGACDSSGDEEERLADGTFEATVSGSLTGALSGEAFYGVGSDPELFQIVMIEADDGDTTGVALVRLVTEVPEKGSYEIADAGEVENDPSGPPDDVFFGVVGSQADSSAFLSRSGMLEITHAGGGRLEGTFQFESGEFFGTGNASVEGRFNAEQVEEPPQPAGNAFGAARLKGTPREK